MDEENRNESAEEQLHEIRHRELKLADMENIQLCLHTQSEQLLDELAQMGDYQWRREIYGQGDELSDCKRECHRFFNNKYEELEEERRKIGY